MLRLDLRLRIALAFAVVCIAVVGALGVTLYTAAEDLEETLVNQIVSEEVDYLINRYRADPDYRPTAGPNFEYHIVRTAEDARAVYTGALFAATSCATSSCSEARSDAEFVSLADWIASSRRRCRPSLTMPSAPSAV